MIRYMLDTNTVIYAQKRRPPSVLARLMMHDPSEICISSITLAEMYYGVFNSSKPDQNKTSLLKFFSNIAIIPFDSSASIEYGSIRYFLKSTGSIIGANDMLIAAHARSLDAILVTHNTSEFSRVPELKLEDWVEE